jgi:hypothetical protein
MMYKLRSGLWVRLYSTGSEKKGWPISCKYNVKLRATVIKRVDFFFLLLKGNSKDLKGATIFCRYNVFIAGHTRSNERGPCRARDTQRHSRGALERGAIVKAAREISHLASVVKRKQRSKAIEGGVQKTWKGRATWWRDVSSCVFHVQPAGRQAVPSLKQILCCTALADLCALSLW